MSLIQTLAARLPARWFSTVKEESEGWKTECPNCGHQRSVWDWGGIRWKAKGSPRWRLTCTSCGHPGWHKVEWRPGPDKPV